MAKIADQYLVVHPWAVIEKGFDAARNRVSESIFSLGNEYMGVRGYAEEGYGGDQLVGSYFNGLYEKMAVNAHYKGTIRSVRFMANAVDWLYTRISVEDEMLDLAVSSISDFQRRLDFRTGTYTRSFIWHMKNGKSMKVIFTRLVSMTLTHLGGQLVEFEPIDFAGKVKVISGLDFSPIHEDQGKNLWETVRSESSGQTASILGKTIRTSNRLFASFALHANSALESSVVEADKVIGQQFELDVTAGVRSGFEKIAVNYAVKDASLDHQEVWKQGQQLLSQYRHMRFKELLDDQTSYWNHIWETSDIEIDGDPENQQGIRFCIFQLYQTYHGDNPGFNIGAKGLTGEAYRGLAFWDTESYCLPFYLFNNPKAAKSLLEFRYKSLPQALERAKDVDCEGAFYPIATIDGTESCDLWQHSNLQLHVGTAIAYGIWHYHKIVGDSEFLYTKGIEMLIQICRFYATRGQWGQRSNQYGYYGVMGPDEFQLMVNNNAYTNFLAKKLFEFTLDVMDEMTSKAPEQLRKVTQALHLRTDEAGNWAKLAQHMKIPQDPVTGVYEEHDGFFDMPHIDIHSIPVTDFPLYSHWSYDRIYRYDMIKQPDVLMFLFLYNQQFTPEIKRANYEFYEPRCIHESSLSPSIHSILAAELGKHDEAYQFFEFATRLDLDNYNRNTREGLHTTSIAAAWMNILYGFGGMRSDGELLQFTPTIPAPWNSYSFRMLYQGSVLEVRTSKQESVYRVVSGRDIEISIQGNIMKVGAEGVTVSMA